MKTSLKKLQNSQAELEVSITAEEFNGFVEKAILSLGKNLEIEGFRKGKLPKEIIEQKIGSERILYEAANLAVRESLPRAILESKIEAISEPEISILKIARGNPFVFKAKVLTLPKIKLGDYRKIASQVKKEKIKVNEKEVQSALDWLKKNHLKDQKEKIPETDDEWARILGKFKNITELKKSIKEGIKLEKEMLEQRRVRQEILDKITKNSKIEIPEILIEREKNQMLENIKKGVDQTLKMTFEDYLKKIKKTEKELLESLFKEAEKRIKNSLLIKEIGKRENISVSEKEITAKVNKFLKGYLNVKEAKKTLDPEALKVYTREVIKNEKTFQFLESFAQ